MLTRNTVMGLITIGVLVVMMLYIALTPSPFKYVGG